MPAYAIHGVDITIPDHLATARLASAFTSGGYELAEALAVLRHLKPPDRFLDLGAGAGYLCALAGRVRGAGAVAGVEAGPEMAAVARANLALNRLPAAEIVWGAVVPDDHAGDSIPFTVRRAFWASSLAPPETARGTTVVAVPAQRFCDLLARFRPTVLGIDIEGGERDLFQTRLPADLRMLIMELHRPAYGKAGVKRIFDALSAQGFGYCPMGSKSALVVFERVAAA